MSSPFVQIGNDDEIGTAGIAALRYSDSPGPRPPSEDAPFRVFGPLPSPIPLPKPTKIESFTLDNGLQVVVVERHAFPMVAARLVIATGASMSDDVGGHNTYLLGGVFLSPERIIQTSGGCTVVGCQVASRGLSNQLGEVLGRIADLAIGLNGEPAVYERWLTISERQYQRAENPVKRNMQALLFGPSHRYGSPPAATTPTLATLQQLRDRVFVASASTLVVVGDTTPEAVKLVASRTFGRWSRRESAGSVAAAPPPSPSGSHIVFAPNRGISQVWGSVAARGPAPRDSDTPAYLVLAKLLGGRTDSAAFTHVREDMKAAYTIGGEIDSYEDASVMSLTGSFDQASVAIGMQGLLDSVAAARDAAPAVEDLDRAKTVVIAGLSRAIATDEGLASTLGNAFLLGLTPQAVQDRFGLVKAVSAADVQAVARRYLAPDCVRVVLMGRPEAISDARGLGFGEPAMTDGFGRLLPSR